MPFDRAGWASQLSRKSCCSMNLLEPRIAPEFDECCVTSGASRRRSRARIVGLSGAASRQRVAVPGGRTVIGAAGHTPESPYEPQGWVGAAGERMGGFLRGSQRCSQGYDRSSVTDARQTKGGTGGLDLVPVARRLTDHCRPAHR
jgi:hypothetical protein